MQPGVQVAAGREMAVRGEVAASQLAQETTPKRRLDTAASAAGAVRVRAAGESVPPAEKRNQ